MKDRISLLLVATAAVTVALSETLGGAEDTVVSMPVC